MRATILLVILIVFSMEQGPIKQSRRSKHGEDCYSDAACEEGFHCVINRCSTVYESKNLKNLGLLETNLCDLKKKCKSEKICVKHRCVDKDTPTEQPMNKTENIDDVHLIFSGSVMLNNRAYLSGIKADNTFNYDHLFKNIEKNIKSADLAITTLHSVFNIEENEKKFKKDHKNTPKELGDALAKAGFKVILHASPYAYSHKEKGIIDTLNFWKTNHKDVHPLGIYATMEECEKNYFIFTQDNIKIGIINYSGFSVKSIPKNKQFMINTLSKKRIEEELPKLKQMVDFLIVCVEWGDKTGSSPNKLQIGWAKSFAEIGADLIVGNYPRYVQPVTFVKSKNGNKALVVFSLGSLVYDDKKNKATLGALGDVIISKANKKTFISSFNMIPILNHKTEKEYTIYTMADYNEDLGLDMDKKFSKEKLRKDCKNLFGGFSHCLGM